MKHQPLDAVVLSLLHPSPSVFRKASFCLYGNVS